MWRATLLLYVSPLIVRAGLEDWQQVALMDVVLSVFPLVVVFPSIFLPRTIADENTEHVVRHGLYAAAFSISAGTCVRWDYIHSMWSDQECERDCAWIPGLLAYLITGTVTLWWFCVSHIIENQSMIARLYTHQGDVAVLPLTLVAIATFAEFVPDEAFRFSRSIVFFVPIVVAWATLHFIAYNSFATSTTTTHSQNDFGFLAYCGLVVAVAHLILIEVRASTAIFQVFPLVAAVLCQITPRPGDRPRLRHQREAGVVTLSAALGGGILGGILLSNDGSTTETSVVIGCMNTVIAVCMPHLAGRRWIVPGSLYLTLLATAYFDWTDPRRIIITLVGSLIVNSIVETLAPSTLHNWEVPSTPSLTTDHPQDRVKYSFAKLLRMGNVGCATGCEYDGSGNFLKLFFRRPIPNCPKEFAGVWWMCGNSFPMQLVSIHHATWEGQQTTLWMAADTTRSATMAGMILWLGQALCFMHIKVVNGKWIRTDGWVLPLLRLLPDSYWLYRVSDHEMIRIVYNRRGDIVSQYRMLRIAQGPDPRQRTVHYHAFMRRHEGERFWYG